MRRLVLAAALVLGVALPITGGVASAATPAVVGGGCNDPSGQCPPAPVPNGFSLGFVEEFTSTAEMNQGWAATSGGGPGSSITADGTAELLAGANGYSSSIASGTTAGYTDFGPYGYIAIRARLLGDQYGNMFMELAGQPGTGQTSLQIANTGFGSNYPTVGLTCQGGTGWLLDVNDGSANVGSWHTYTLAWTPNRAVFGIDGVPRFSLTGCGSDTFPDLAEPFQLGSATIFGSRGSTRLQVDWIEADTCNSGFQGCP